MISQQVQGSWNFANLQSGTAMIAGAGFDTLSFRQKFDISIPVFSPMTKHVEVSSINYVR